MWNYTYSSDPTLENSLFGTVKLVKNAEIDQQKFSGYGTAFAMKGTFGFPAIGFGENVMIFGADMDSSEHIDILILGKGPTQELHGTMLTADKMYSINFREHNKKFCLSLHYNGQNSYLFVNGS